MPNAEWQALRRTVYPSARGGEIAGPLEQALSAYFRDEHPRESPAPAIRCSGLHFDARHWYFQLTGAPAEVSEREDRMYRILDNGTHVHLRVQKALQRIVDAVVPSHCALGIMVNSSAAAREWQARGARYITTTFESLVAPAMRSYLRGAREG